MNANLAILERHKRNAVEYLNANAFNRAVMLDAHRAALFAIEAAWYFANEIARAREARMSADDTAFSHAHDALREFEP